MYAGAFLLFKASIHASHGSFMQMGSRPGVLGLSGMQVHSVVPCRSTFPFESKIVACSANEGCDGRTGFYPKSDDIEKSN